MTHDKNSANTPFSHGISRRKLLSTLALGSTALGMSNLGTAVVSISGGGGHLASLISGSTPNADSFHDTLFSPALAQLTSEGFFVFDERVRVFSETGFIGGSKAFGSFAATLTLVTAGPDVVGDRFSDYWYTAGEGESEVNVGEIGRQTRNADDSFDVMLPARVIPAVDGGEPTFTFSPELSVDFAANLEALAAKRLQIEDVSTFSEVYPVTTFDSADNEYIVGFYTSAIRGLFGNFVQTWTFAPLAGGVDKSWELFVPLNIDGEVEHYPLGSVAETIVSSETDRGTVIFIDRTDGTLPEVGGSFLAAEDAGTAEGARRQDLSAALNALNPAADDATPDTAALTNFWTAYQASIPTMPATMPAPATETVAPDTPAPATVTVAPDTPAPATVTDAPGPTTSTMAPTTANATIAPTTANATIAPTTTLVSTTVGSATMAGTTLVSTTLVSTTLVSPTIAGELSVRGAINAQGNIGGNVARSLSGRLSSFRSRNRNKTGQGN